MLRRRGHVGEKYHLLTWVYREQARRSQERLLATEIVEQGASGESEAHAPVRGALPGDRAKLRGIPVIVEGGMGGTVPGTQPEQAVVMSSDP